MGHTYALGAVKPWVREAAQEIGDKFDVSTIYGIGARTGPSEHPLGRALDFMVYGDRAKGDEIAAYVKQHWGHLGVMYEIWFQRIDNGTGWEDMEDRGGTTANHKDHVHVSFLATGAGGPSYEGGDVNAGATTGAGGGSMGENALSGLTNPQTWMRVLEFVAGVILIALAFYPLISRASGGIV